MNVNLARVDLVSIRLALLCAELGSLSAAAKSVHCSLSTGSTRLSMLEETLGTPLFVRDHRGLHPTPACKDFVQHAQAILRHVELLIDATSDHAAARPSPLPSRSSYLERLAA